MTGYVSSEYGHATLLQGTSAIAFAKGLVGANGALRDTLLLGVYIDLHAATGAVLTIGGITDSNGAPASLVLNGQTTVDVPWQPPFPMLNEGGVMTFTPSVAGVITVFTRAFTGP